MKLIVLLLALAAPAQACLELNGEARQGALLWGQVQPGSRAFLDEEALFVSDDGIVVFGFGRDESGEAVLRVEGEQACEQLLSIAQREYRIQRVEGVPQQTVTPDLEHMERIRRERELVRAAKDKSGARTYSPRVFPGRCRDLFRGYMAASESITANLATPITALMWPCRPVQ